MHNALTMCIIKSLANFVSVKLNVHFGELFNEQLCRYCVDVFKNETRRFFDWVSDTVVEFDNVWTFVQSLQDFDLSVDLNQSNWLQYFDSALFVVQDVAAFVNFGVVTTTKLCDDLIIVERTPIYVQLLILRILCRSLCTNIFVKTLKLVNGICVVVRYHCA